MSTEYFNVPLHSELEVWRGLLVVPSPLRNFRYEPHKPRGDKPQVRIKPEVMTELDPAQVVEGYDGEVSF